MKRFFITSFLTVSVVLSCKTKVEEATSEPSWGHYKTHDPWMQAVLVNVPPQGSILVCSYDSLVGKSVYDATVAWMRAMGRAPHLQIQFAEGQACRPQDFDAVIDVYPHTHRSAGTCTKKFGEGMASGFADVKNRRAKYGGQIVYCQNNMKGEGIVSTVLHEVGHLVGMCDQWIIDSVGKFHNMVMGADCDDTNRSKNAGLSVMNGGIKNFTSLQSDDILGAKAMNSRKNLPNYEIWRRYLSGNLEIPRADDNTNSPQAATPNQKPTASAIRDADEDGVADQQDLCRATPLGHSPNTTPQWMGCAPGQYRDKDLQSYYNSDSDGDGVSDRFDRCYRTPRGSRVWNYGQFIGCAYRERMDR